MTGSIIPKGFDTIIPIEQIVFYPNKRKPEQIIIDKKNILGHSDLFGPVFINYEKKFYGKGKNYDGCLGLGPSSVDSDVSLQEVNVINSISNTSSTLTGVLKTSISAGDNKIYVHNQQDWASSSDGKVIVIGAGKQNEEIIEVQSANFDHITLEKNVVYNHPLGEIIQDISNISCEVCVSTPTPPIETPTLTLTPLSDLPYAIINDGSVSLRLEFNFDDVFDSLHILRYWGGPGRNEFDTMSPPILYFYSDHATFSDMIEVANNNLY